MDEFLIKSLNISDVNGEDFMLSRVRWIRLRHVLS
jgi:hypothetical protein